ncbi:MAG: acetyl-CoA carboxylase, carboxyltransferase subunit beta [Hyphomicrobium sp.]
MNWINNVVRPKIRSFLTTKREVPDNMWVKCPVTGQMVFYKDLEANQFVFPGSNHHERMSAPLRLASIFDGGTYDKVAVPAVAQDPLKFRDGRRYTDRLKDAKSKTNLDDAVMVAQGQLDGQRIIAAVQDFDFMAGSLGMAAGEAILTGMLRAVEKKCPFILFAASGGARMQEGILSLMQMPRTTIAVQRLREAKLPYIVVLTDPTTGGVTASYAMLGDIHIAEPGALICFAGPRVIQQTIREQLPEGFQRSEYLLAHGMIDMVVHRHKLRETLSRVCRLLMAGDGVTRDKARRINGNAYTNGATVDAKVIETAARESAGESIDAPAKPGSDARDKTKREADVTIARTGGKDGARS